VASSPYGNHFLEDVWPDPLRFDPGRFAPDRREDKVHRLAFQAFGAGVHKCIGMHFAGMQVRAAFHELLTTYRWSVPAGYEMPIDMAALPVARDGLPVTLERLR
jgi:cytochrome P450